MKAISDFSRGLPVRILTVLLVLVLTVPAVSGCFAYDIIKLLPFKTEETVESEESSGASIEITTENTTIATTEPEPEPVFVQDLAVLERYGVGVDGKTDSSKVSSGDMFELMVESYEAIAGEVDISLMSPFYETSEHIRKLTRLEVYHSDYFYPSEDPAEISYSGASFWLFEIYRALLEKTPERVDERAYPSDLLAYINMSSALSSWRPEAIEKNVFSLSNLLRPLGAFKASQPLTRLNAARMMVAAYEQSTNKSLETWPANKPVDTEDISAWKANNFFVWPESEYFEPDLTGAWNDLYFLGADSYDWQLRSELQPADQACPYGAVVSAFAVLLETAAEFEITTDTELIVLNERPYPWYINQRETGEYGAVNCMPSCIEMSMRYQNLTVVPSAESLRAAWPLDGMGWTDILAEDLMIEHGLVFGTAYATDVETTLQQMMVELDAGNILYVMYIEDYATEGHAVILKGYRVQGDIIEFVVSDPDSSQIGPFGYVEYLRDARIMIEGILKHVPRYFVIPPEENVDEAMG